MGSKSNFEMEYVDRHNDNFIADLKEFISIPSVTQDLDAARKAAEWVSRKERRQDYFFLKEVRVVGLQ